MTNLFATIYYSHIIVFVAFIVYTYTFIHRLSFQKIRRTIAASNLLAFVILSVYRTMPPRMLPQKYGFIDVLHPPEEPGEPSWTHNKYQLTIAAMPSLHFGMSGLIAVSITRYAPHMFLRILAPFWPFLMLVTILATANHFIIDAVVGAFVPVVAWQISDGFLIFRPLEEWFLWLLRTKKPAAADQNPIAYEQYQSRQGTLLVPS